MFYKEKEENELREELFKSPSVAYKGAPFWAWNKKLNKEELVDQVEQFKKMGMGGFHIHCRVGLDTEYLGEEFFSCVEACEEKAKEEGLLCYLYDEDRWPSGSAGGLVTKDLENRTRFLVLAPVGYEEKEEEGYMAAAKAVRSKNRTHLGYYRIFLDEQGFLSSYEFSVEKPEDTENVWEAYLEISGDTPWFNNQAYVNTLDKKAIRKFLDITHEQYYKRLGEDFGSEIKSIFTDEPQTTHKGMLVTPFDQEPVITPFTDDFDKTFQEKYGYSVIQKLPEIFWETKDDSGLQVRYHYHDHVMERFSEAFGDQIGKWCLDHGIYLTGHMLNEWTLYSQTLAIGECMRPMKNFGMPGVDMLCDRRELSTLKQAESVSRQQGREGVMCEIYGVTGWTFDFRNHKLAGDWQAALGVTFRVPHLTWVSMEGEGKRDYPACIGRHSPWYEKYNLIEDHFARLNTALTRGKACVRVGVIHPVESYWMYWGNKEQTSLKRQVLEENFENLIKWMLFGLIDFDFISESLLGEEADSGADESGKELCDYGELTGDKSEKRGFSVGQMNYDVVVIPECATLRSSTVEKLENFVKRGGKVIFMGETAKFVDAAPSDRVKKLEEKAVHIPFSRVSLMEALEPERDIDIDVFPLDGVDPSRMKHKENGNRADNLFYQMRQDGNGKWLFICHVNKPRNEAIAWNERWDIKIKGEYQAVCYDTMTGEIFPVKVEHVNGNTVVHHVASFHDSLLLKLIPVEDGVKAGENLEMQAEKNPEGKWVQEEEFKIPQNQKNLPQPCSYKLEERNSLLLDQAEYAFDDGKWQQREELLRIDNLFREKLHYPLRMEALAQPWTEKEEETLSHALKLRFTIPSEIEMDEVELAMEHPEVNEIFWNEEPVKYEDSGFYVDESIRTCKLKNLHKGENILVVKIPFGRKTNVEWMYLLGAFGTKTAGQYGIITALPEKLYFGDITRQNLAFYGGNLEYTSKLHTEAGILNLEVSHYRGALLEIFLDGENKGALFMAPYRINLGKVDEGLHEITIKVYGNRSNTFGVVHNADRTEAWYGPNLWRTEGNKWSYEYQLEQMGVLTTPVYWVEKEID